MNKITKINEDTALVDILKNKFLECKVGVIIKGFENIHPINIANAVSEERNSKIYVSAPNYKIVENDNEELTVSDKIEDAVKWRSNPSHSGKILVFVKNEIDKLHSLKEFDVISVRDVTKFVISQQNNNITNKPTEEFWKALEETSDYYSLDIVSDFINAVNSSETVFEAIPVNMWRLNLLCDRDILSQNGTPSDRLEKNRELIMTIGQLSIEARRKLTRSLTKVKSEEKQALKTAYRNLQNYFKYGNRETLQDLDYSIVLQIFYASTANKNNKKSKNDTNEIDPKGMPSLRPQPIKEKDLNKIIVDNIVNPKEGGFEDLQELLDIIKASYDDNQDTEIENIPSMDGIFDNRPFALSSHQNPLRKLVGKVCNATNWGGVLPTDETVLKNVISSEYDNDFQPFCPTDDEKSYIHYADGSIFDLIKRFDDIFKQNNIERLDYFETYIDHLIELRNKLADNIDLIMYYPILSFGCDGNLRNTLIDYIDTWAAICKVYSENEAIMMRYSSETTKIMARFLLMLDTLYIRTPKEWKGVLLPLHPMYLWRYYEVFKTLSKQNNTIREDDAIALREVLNDLPNVLNFITVDVALTKEKDVVLPCSGSIEMLPTFENKTNRYLGADGVNSISEILTRWIGFAPYTKQEIRICLVDAPDLLSVVRSIKEFMDKNYTRRAKDKSSRVVCDVYYTRGQNGNVELSRFDYAGDDYEIGEYITDGRISIKIKNVENSEEVRRSLKEKPVHVAFFFDQSSYSIKYGPSTHNLYINPLVVTYDYEFDEVTHHGRIFPTSDMDSGLIGDYHKLMRTAAITNSGNVPRTTYSENADISAVVVTIEDESTQWLVVADRDTGNYVPPKSIPIGEKQYDGRMVNIWASQKSRIISQYLDMLRGYNLYPNADVLTSILKNFGHIASNGLISIPKFGSNTQAIENIKKGLLGTLFAATWYTKKHSKSLVASLDNSRARLWLHDNDYGDERADLIGLWYDEEAHVLHVEPIEVKTRDENPDANVVDKGDGINYLEGHASDQIAAVVEMLNEIFNFDDDNSSDMFISARREVLKFQIVSECFRNIHDTEWQKQWSSVFKDVFSYSKNCNTKIEISGILIHVKLSDTTGGRSVTCVNSDFDDCPILYVTLTSEDIQKEILDGNYDVDMSWNDTKSGKKDSTDNQVLTSTVHKSNDTDPDDDPDGEDNNGVESSETSRNDSYSEHTGTEKSASNDFSPVDSGTDDSALDSENDNTEDDSSATAVDYSTKVSMSEIQELAAGFRRSCQDYNIKLLECDAKNSVVGPSVIRIKFRLARGQALSSLLSHIEDIGREMKRSGVLVQQIQNSDELLLDIPRLTRDKVLFKDIIGKLPKTTSPEQLFFPLGRTPNGEDLIKNLSDMPHLLVGGSTGSGKTIFLFTILASLIKSHPYKKDMTLVLSSSKMEDFIYFQGLPHLYNDNIISDATEATNVIMNLIFQESERRGKLLADARKPNIEEYNKTANEKLAPIVVVIDEFADLVDQLSSNKERKAFYKPVQRIAQMGRSRGIHLVICTQRPEAKLVPSTTKAQLNGKVALRVNDGISSKMIIDCTDAQYLQKHGDLIYKNGSETERAQGYFIDVDELTAIVEETIKLNG